MLTRPILRWHGGKWKLAPWIISHFPEHRVYVEPFGGAASVLLRKDRSYAEVYNDLDGDVVTLFQVLRDPLKAARLKELIELTPYARAEYVASRVECDDPLEQARRLLVRSFMGFASNGHNIATKTGFRGNSNRSGTTPAHDWRNYAAALEAFTKRLQGVVVENRNATEVMLQHDGLETLHYVDPPYLPETRSSKSRPEGMYTHEMTDEDHAHLIGVLQSLSGMVVLSGYASGLYDESLLHWRRVELATFGDGATPRTEVLWINPSAADRLRIGQRELAGLSVSQPLDMTLNGGQP